MTRRELSALLPLLWGLPEKTSEDSGLVLPSKCYEFDQLAVKTNPETHIESRQVFRGETHGRFEIACHMTKLPPGAMPHPPHRHVNEEIFFLREGTVEITVEGKSTRLTPGGISYVASNELHGARNVGDVPAQYFVLELDGQH